MRWWSRSGGKALRASRTTSASTQARRAAPCSSSRSAAARRRTMTISPLRPASCTSARSGTATSTASCVTSRRTHSTRRHATSGTATMQRPMGSRCRRWARRRLWPRAATQRQAAEWAATAAAPERAVEDSAHRRHHTLHTARGDICPCPGADILARAAGAARCRRVRRPLEGLAALLGHPAALDRPRQLAAMVAATGRLD
mmetsp:Transcript_11999/g.35401  ORF Transcript_11999/g.35401 Transcript_11999/m.35401 type:complete len:201 (+) Transcript_11999:512-1114(+)